MRKRGKYEAVPQKAQRTGSRHGKKRGLLQIYVTSMVTLVMCLSMFLGTTMAWFTDTVSSGGNLIQTGVLKVDVQYGNVSLRDYPATKVFNVSGLTPGNAVTSVIAIRNEGTLPVLFNLGLVKEAGETAVASQFTVHCESVSSTAAVSINTDNLGSGTNLVDVFDGKSIAQDDLAPSETVYYAITIKMNPNASESAQGKAIQMALKLNAYQADIPSEYIGTEEVSNSDELTSALAAGKKTAMTDDITISANMTMDGGSLDGGYHTLTADYTSPTYDCAITTTGGLVTNLNIVGTGKDGNIRAIGSGSSGSCKLTQDLILREVTIDSVQYAINGSGNGTAKVSVSNSNIYGWISFADIAQFSFSDCTLGSGNSYMGYQVIYGNTSYDNCTFIDFHLCSRSSVPTSTTVTFTDCTYIKDGVSVKVTADNFEELFFMEGDETDFAWLNICEITVDNSSVTITKGVTGASAQTPSDSSDTSTTT